MQTYPSRGRLHYCHRLSSLSDRLPRDYTVVFLWCVFCDFWLHALSCGQLSLALNTSSAHKQDRDSSSMSAYFCVNEYDKLFPAAIWLKTDADIYRGCLFIFFKFVYSCRRDRVYKKRCYDQPCVSFKVIWISKSKQLQRSRRAKLLVHQWVVFSPKISPKE